MVQRIDRIVERHGSGLEFINTPLSGLRKTAILNKIDFPNVSQFASNSLD